MSAALTQAGKKSTTQQVMEAVEELHGAGQLVTRETLHRVTGLKMVVIDDRLKMLAADDKIARVERGVYIPVVQHPEARLVCKMVLPDGTVKIDIGDQVLTLTPKENRMLGELMAGAGQQYHAIKLGDQNELLAAQLAAKVRRLERQVQALQVEGGRADTAQQEMWGQDE